MSSIRECIFDVKEKNINVLDLDMKYGVKLNIIERIHQRIHPGLNQTKPFR
jgi:hypothetical protein